MTGSPSAGNAALLKGGGKLAWPEALQGAGLDAAGRGLSQDLQLAVTRLKDKGPLPAALLRDIRGDFKSLGARLGDSADDLLAARNIEARRFLNVLGGAVKAPAGPGAANHFNGTWKVRGKTVAELVANTTREGLTFVPAGLGDEAACRSLYQSLRAFAGGLHTAEKWRPSGRPTPHGGCRCSGACDWKGM